MADRGPDPASSPSTHCSQGPGLGGFLLDRPQLCKRPVWGVETQELPPGAAGSRGGAQGDLLLSEAQMNSEGAQRWHLGGWALTKGLETPMGKDGRATTPPKVAHHTPDAPQAEQGHRGTSSSTSGTHGSRVTTGPHPLLPMLELPPPHP